MTTFRQQVLDRIVLWRMEQQGEIEEDWLDPDTDMIDRDRLPAHALGPYDQIVENAEPLADQIVYVAQARLD